MVVTNFLLGQPVPEDQEKIPVSHNLYTCINNRHFMGKPTPLAHWVSNETYVISSSSVVRCILRIAIIRCAYLDHSNL